MRLGTLGAPSVFRLARTAFRFAPVLPPLKYDAHPKTPVRNQRGAYRNSRPPFEDTTNSISVSGRERRFSTAGDGDQMEFGRTGMKTGGRCFGLSNATAFPDSISRELCSENQFLSSGNSIPSTETGFLMSGFGSMRSGNSNMNSVFRKMSSFSVNLTSGSQNLRTGMQKLMSEIKILSSGNGFLSS